MMLVRDAVAADVDWAPAFVLDGFEREAGEMPSANRIHASIIDCMSDGFALVAEHEGQVAGVLGARVVPSFWAEGDDVSVIALRSVVSGAGMALIREARRRAFARFGVRRFVVGVNGGDTKCARVMRALGARQVTGFVFRGS